jgi:hypothetical protein
METRSRDSEGYDPQEVASENMGDFMMGESVRRWDGVPGGVVGNTLEDWSMKSHDD